MIYLLPTIIILVGLFLYAEYDPWFKELLYILVAAVGLELRKIPFLIHMEWDLFWMKRNLSRHLEMARKIQKELDNETN
jgi:hypothetical protein